MALAHPFNVGVEDDRVTVDVKGWPMCYLLRLGADGRAFHLT